MCMLSSVRVKSAWLAGRSAAGLIGPPATLGFVADWLGRAAAPGLSPLLLLYALLAPLPVRAQPSEQWRWLTGHTQGVYSVAVSSDGQAIISAGLDGQVIVWDRASGQATCRIPASPVGLLALDVSTAAADAAARGTAGMGAMGLAVGGLDRTVRLFDLPRMQPLAAMMSFAGQPKAVAASPDGQIVVTADSGRLIRQWNPINGGVARDFGGAASDVAALALIGDPPLLLVACADGTLQSWHVESGQPAGSLWTAPLASVAVGPEGKSLIVGGKDGVLRLLAWPPTAARGLAGHGGAVSAVVLSRRGDWAATACVDHQVRVFDTASAQQLRSLPGLAGPATALAMSADEQVLVAASTTGKLQCWNPHDGTDLGAVRGHDGPVRGLAFHPRRLEFASGGADGLVRWWRMPQPINVLGAHAAVPQCAAVSRDGRWGASGDAERIVRLWDLKAGSETGRLEGHTAAITCVALSARGEWAASGDASGIVRLWDRTGAKPLGALGAHAAAVTSLAFDPTGQRLLSTAADGTAKLWRLPYRQSEILEGHIEPVRSVAASRDGSVLASAADDQTVRVWQRGEEPRARAIAWQGAAVTAVDVSTDGRLIVAGNAMGQVRVWRADGNDVALLQAESGAVASIRFDPRAERVAAASTDGAVRIWKLPANLDLGQQPLVLQAERVLAAHEGATTSVAWSPDGARLVTAGVDRSVRLWNAALEEPPLVFTGAAEAIVSVALGGEPLRVLALTADRQLVAWNGASPATPQPLATVAAPARCLAVSHDAKLACVGGEDGVVRLIDLLGGRELESFFGHRAAVASVALADNGKIAVSASLDKSVKVWHPAAELVVNADAQRANCSAFLDAMRFVAGGQAGARVWDLEGKVVAELPGGQGLVSLAANAAGTLLAGGGADMNLYVWRLPEGELAAAIPTPAAILGVACAEDGSKVCVAHADQTLRTYVPEAGWLGEQVALPAVPASVAWVAGQDAVLVACADQQVRFVPLALMRVFAAHEAAITGLCYLADGKELATSGEDGSVRLWDGNQGRELAARRVSAGPVSCIACFLTRIAAAAIDRTVSIWDAADPAAEVVLVTLPAVVHAISFSSNGAQLAAACEDGQIHCIDLASRQPLERCVGHAGPVHALAHAAQSETLVSGGTDGVAYVWKPSGRAAVAASPQSISFVALGDTAHVVVAAADGSWGAWQTSDLTPAWHQDAQGSFRALASSQAGTVALADDARVRLIEAGTGKLLAAVELDEPPTAAALGRDLLIVSSAGSRLRVFQVRDRAGALQVEPAYDLAGLTQPALALALAEKSHVLYAASSEPALRRWFAASLVPRIEWADRPAPIHAAALNAQGTRIAVGEGTEVAVYDTATGLPLARCVGHTGAVWGLAFQPGGERLASAGADGRIRLWDPQGNQLAVWADPAGKPLHSVSWRPDGQRLAAAGRSRLWYLFDPGAQQPLLQGHGHNDTVYRAAFNPAGNRLATIDFSGGLCIWDAGDGRLLYHHQLPATTAWSLAYTPDGRELAVGTQDPRVLVLTTPP